MKKEEENGQKPEYINYSEEEQLLDLNELMDVQGGIDDKELSKCGLGCYTGGFVDPTKTQDENTGNTTTNGSAWAPAAWPIFCFRTSKAWK